MSRRLRLAVVAVLSLAGLTVGVSVAMAQLQTTGRGREMRLVREQFPQEHRPRYDLFAEKCTQCHAMARPISALQTGITPVTGGTFDEEGIRRYVVRMMRKPNSGIDRSDAREIILFLTYAREAAQAQGDQAAQSD